MPKITLMLSFIDRNPKSSLVVLHLVASGTLAISWSATVRHCESRCGDFVVGFCLTCASDCGSNEIIVSPVSLTLRYEGHEQWQLAPVNNHCESH